MRVLLIFLLRLAISKYWWISLKRKESQMLLTSVRMSNFLSIGDADLLLWAMQQTGTLEKSILFALIFCLSQQLHNPHSFYQFLLLYLRSKFDSSQTHFLLFSLFWPFRFVPPTCCLHKTTRLAQINKGGYSNPYSQIYPRSACYYVK